MENKIKEETSNVTVRLNINNRIKKLRKRRPDFILMENFNKYQWEYFV